jgi:YHS domain-containing protein
MDGDDSELGQNQDGSLNQDQTDKDLSSSNNKDNKDRDNEADDDQDQDRLEKIVEEDESLHHQKTSSHRSETNNKNNNNSDESRSKSAPSSSSNETKDKTFTTSVKPGTPVMRELPEKGPESQDFVNRIKFFYDSLRSLISAVITMTGNEPVNLDIYKKKADSASGGKNDGEDIEETNLDNETKPLDECCIEASQIIEKIFKFQATEFDPSNEEEDQGDFDEDDYEAEEEANEEGEDEVEGEEEEEEDEDRVYDPSAREKTVSFGETSHYCPVVLKDRGILQPGNAEIQSRFREKFYRFSSEEARNSFIENPELYLPSSRKRLEVCFNLI